MDQIERLTNMIAKAERSMWGKSVDGMMGTREYIARCLLEDGAIVPPCKVGDTVYIIDEPDFDEPYVLDVTITAIGYDIGGFWITMNLPLGLKMSAHIGERSFGKTVFLTREEAESALKERL